MVPLFCTKKVRSLVPLFCTKKARTFGPFILQKAVIFSPFILHKKTRIFGPFVLQKSGDLQSLYFAQKSAHLWSLYFPLFCNVFAFHLAKSISSLEFAQITLQFYKQIKKQARVLLSLHKLFRILNCFDNKNSSEFLYHETLP